MAKFFSIEQEIIEAELNLRIFKAIQDEFLDEIIKWPDLDYKLCLTGICKDYSFPMKTYMDISDWQAEWINENWKSQKNGSK